MPAPAREHVFFASFLVAPFVGQAKMKRNLGDDPRAQPFKTLKKHVEGRKPPIALLEVQDWEVVHERQRREVLKVLLDDKTLPGGPWGLRSVPGYVSLRGPGKYM